MPNLMTANDYKPHHGEGVLGKPPPYPYAMPPSAPSGQDQQRAGGSPMETILVNILGLLKVAIENARMWEEQIRNEKSKQKSTAVRVCVRNRCCNSFTGNRYAYYRNAFTENLTDDFDGRNMTLVWGSVSLPEIEITLQMNEIPLLFSLRILKARSSRTPK